MLSDMLGRDVTKADRALMIEFGQKYREWFGQDVWCRFTESDMKFGQMTSAIRRTKKPIVITDGRHLVEYDYFVTQRGFVPVRIVADDDIRFNRLLQRDGVDQRAVLAGQETELDGVEVSFVIDNNGTMDELCCQIDEMVEKLRGEAR